MRRCPAARRPGTGSVIVNTAPGRSVRFAAVIVPPMASTKPREIASPSPVPARTWSPFSRAMELVEDALELLRRNAARPRRRSAA